ncbi:MAG: sigma-70 family RNA polymerase sigma factor [Acidobacteriota bacterium]|nr:sigma-70 family RNA polymerase sigma factor [Acidobacteriota bacterium]
MTHGSAIRKPFDSPAFGRALAQGGWRVTVVNPTAPDAAALLGLDDAALVAACVSGRREAFDVIVERHRRTVYQVCYRFVCNHEDASDLSQEAFVRAWRGLKNFKGQSQLSTWLYRIAVNVCLNKVSLKTPATEPIESIERFEDTRTESARSMLLREERAATVRKAIAGLPKKQRATLILRAYHEMSHQQIADVLGSSVGAVKANFFHALANLKKILGSEP